MRPLVPPASDSLELSLANAKQMAIKKNLTILASRERLTAAEADVLAARLYPNPQVSYNYSFFDPFSKPIDVSGAQGVLRLDQTIPLGGKRSARIDAAEFGVEATKSDFAASLQQLVCDVKDAYADLQYSYLKLDLAKRSYSVFERLLTASQARFKAGDIAEQDVTKIELENLSTSQALNDAEQAVADARARLYSFLGLDPLVNIKITDPLQLSPQSLSTDSLVKVAEESRLDIRAQQHRLKAGERAIDAANAAVIPDLDLGVELDRAGGSAKNYFGVGVGIALPIFSRNQDEIQRSQANYRAAQYDMEGLKLGLHNDVTSAVVKYKNSLSAVKKMGPNITGRAEDVRETSIKNYNAGHIGLLELLESDRIHNDAITSYYAALYQLAKNQITLERVVGKELF